MAYGYLLHNYYLGFEEAYVRYLEHRIREIEQLNARLRRRNELMLIFEQLIRRENAALEAKFPVRNVTARLSQLKRSRSSTF